MFEHSVKVPRHFKIAANIVKKVSSEGGSVKTLLYDEKLRHFRTNVLYALITETIKHAGDLDKLFENSGLLTSEPRLDPWLAKVLTAELLFGKKNLPGKSKPEQTILSYKEQFEKYVNENQDVLKTKAVRRPRYVRVNTNLLTTSDAIRAFQDEGYRFIRCTSGSYEDYLKQIQGLTEYDFTQDYHVKTMFVFSSGTKLHEHDLYLENKIILQDKATAMAVHLLTPPPGSVVLDMCAAPGMKTTQLAAYIRNQGKIYAVERNEKRYQTLCDFVEKTGSKCVETLHKDALEIKRGELDDVEYILLDPSCSGSGMELCVHNYIEDTRLAKLTSLQEKFLKHAMNAFPKAKRIVYSTCSLFPEENERVITNVVKTSRAKWRVQEVKELLKGQWNNFGSGMYGSIGARCMYSRPDTDLTTGFFLAVLDRDQKDLEKNKVDEKVYNDNQSTDKSGIMDISSNKEKKRKIVNEVDTECVKGDCNTDEDVPKKKKKKRKDKENEGKGEVDQQQNTSIFDSTLDPCDRKTEDSHKKKKKKKKNHEINIEENQSGSEYVSNVNSTLDVDQMDTPEECSKKKKKKNKELLENSKLSINDPSDLAKYEKKECTSKTRTVDNDDLKLLDMTGNKSDKKKKKKHLNIIDNEEYESNNFDTLNEVSSGDLHKKKKKKYKEENDI